MCGAACFVGRLEMRAESCTYKLFGSKRLVHATLKSHRSHVRFKMSENSEDLLIAGTGESEALGKIIEMKLSSFLSSTRRSVQDNLTSF